MLRYLGIPARVAVGFTSGTWNDGTWTVTDHDAHAWVEAWFAGHGWLAFDPTPGRGTLSATYTNASDSADAIRALGTGRFLGAGSFDPDDTEAWRGDPRGGRRPPESRGALIVPPALVAALLLGLALAEERSAMASRPHRRPAAPCSRRRGQSWRRSFATRARRCHRRPRSTSSRSSSARVESAPTPSRPRSRVRATGRRRALPSPQTRRARELARILSLLRTRLGPGRRIRGFLTVRSLRSGVRHQAR